MLQGVEFHHYVNALRAQHPDAALSRFSVAANAGLGQRGVASTHNPKESLRDYGVRLDKRGYLQLLRSFAIDHGAVHQQARVVAVSVNTLGIASLQLSTGENLQADCYFDCLGALLTHLPASEFVSWQARFPTQQRLQLLANTERPTSLFDFTTAHAQAWRHDHYLPNLVASEWRFSDAGAAQVAAQIDATNAPNSVQCQSVRPGMQLHSWQGNCVALGAAAGYAETLIFDEYFPTYGALERWLELFPSLPAAPSLQRQYNRATVAQFERIAEVHELLEYAREQPNRARYQASEADQWSESLQHRITLFLATGKIAFYEADPMPSHQWAMLLTELGFWPQRLDALLPRFSAGELARRMAQLSQEAERRAAAFAEHDVQLRNLARASGRELSMP